MIDCFQFCFNFACKFNCRRYTENGDPKRPTKNLGELKFSMRALAREVIENRHPSETESPEPLPCVCKFTLKVPRGKSCSDLGPNQNLLLLFHASYENAPCRYVPHGTSCSDLGLSACSQ